MTATKPVAQIVVAVPEHACVMAIAPRGAADASLSDVLVEKIKTTPQDTTLGPDKVWRHIVCTVKEAQELMRFFRALADNFNVHGRSAEATTCATASENARHALVAAGISISN